MQFTSCPRCGYSTTADFVADPTGTTRQVGEGTCPNCGARLDGPATSGVRGSPRLHTSSFGAATPGRFAKVGGAFGAALLFLYFVVKVLIPALSGGMQAPDPATRLREAAPRELGAEDQGPLNIFEPNDDRPSTGAVPDNTEIKLPNLLKAIDEAAKKAAAESSPTESPDRPE